MKTEIKDVKPSHGTIVLGWNNKGEIVYARTFDFSTENKNEQKEALAAFDYVSSNCPNYVIGGTDIVLHQKEFVDKSDED